MDDLKNSLNLAIQFFLETDIYNYSYNYNTYLIKLTKYTVTEEGSYKVLVLINIYMYCRNKVPMYAGNIHYTERRQYKLDSSNNFIEFQ